MAVLEVDKIKAALLGPFGGHHKVIDQATNVAVAEHLDVFRWTKSAVEQGVAVQNPWLHARIVIGFAKTARVGQLQAHDQACIAAHGFAMRTQQGLTQVGNVWGGVGVDHQLPGVGAPVMAHGHRFATPNEFGPGSAKAVPAPAGVV
jgi:hypothetical protein